jgi:hypothetical protein
MGRIVSSWLSVEGSPSPRPSLPEERVREDASGPFGSNGRVRQRLERGDTGRMGEGRFRVPCPVTATYMAAASGYGAPGAHKVRGSLSWGRDFAETEFRALNP